MEAGAIYLPSYFMCEEWHYNNMATDSLYKKYFAFTSFHHFYVLFFTDHPYQADVDSCETFFFLKFLLECTQKKRNSTCDNSSLDKLFALDLLNKKDYIFS
jgi:hypothetical protein